MVELSLLEHLSLNWCGEQNRNPPYMEKMSGVDRDGDGRGSFSRCET